MKNSSFLTIFALACFFCSCDPHKGKVQEKETSLEEAKPPVVVPSFNSDTAYAYIENQVNMGPRVPNSSAHKATGDFLIQTLERLGAAVEVQAFEEKAFDGTTLYLRNIIASYSPEKAKRILLAAHWDTRPFADKDDKDQDQPIDGANDGGSGVAVLLELARLFQNQPPDVGVDIILFDGEDYGEPEGYEGNNGPNKVYWCLGSQYWSTHPHKKGYGAYYGILLDMVGAKNARFYREGVSMQYAPKIVQKVWNVAQKLGHGNHFIPQNIGMITDDHLFINRNASIPTIDIIEYGPESEYSYFGDYHHTHEDNIEIISKETLQAVGETVAYVVYHE